MHIRIKVFNMAHVKVFHRETSDKTRSEIFEIQFNKTKTSKLVDTIFLQRKKSFVIELKLYNAKPNKQLKTQFETLVKFNKHFLQTIRYNKLRCGSWEISKTTDNAEKAQKGGP